MKQEETEEQQPEPTPEAMPIRPTEQRVRLVLLTLFASSVLFIMAGAFLYRIIAVVMHWDEAALLRLSEISTAAERWQVRVLLGINHLTMFIAAGIATVALMYRKYIPENTALVPDGARWPWLNWRDYLGLHRFPSGQSVGLSIALMLVSVPLVLYTYQLNKAIPLPEVLQLMEEQSTEALKALLKTESVGELIANLLLIAVLPAIGEELVFRGIIQNQLMRRMRNPLMVILLGALVFSFAHMQFEGFFPRAVMGILLGWLYWRSGNFWLPVIAHFFNNGAQVLGQYLFQQKISSVDLEQDYQLPWFSAVVSGLLIYWVARMLAGSLGKKII